MKPLASILPDLTDQQIAYAFDKMRTPKPFDITEAMMNRIASCELRLLQLEGIIYALERKVFKL